MKRNLKVKHVVLTILLTVSLMACGGGGGDGESPFGISYTGLTTKTTIDKNNAVELSTWAYQQGAQIKVFFGDVGTIQIQAESDTIDGDCGGSASFTVTIDDQTGDFSGDFDFSNYCEDEVTISGDASFSGQVDLDTEELLEFSLSFDNITVTLDNDSFTLDGNILFDTTASSVTMTMALKDNNTDKVYWLEDYNMTLTGWWNYVEVEVSGRYYDPDYGYVTITTPTPLLIYYGDDYPSEGDFVITGNRGIHGGNTKAKLTALSSTTYEVWADTNGDGTYDWNSGVLNWFDL